MKFIILDDLKDFLRLTYKLKTNLKNLNDN